MGRGGGRVEMRLVKGCGFIEDDCLVADAGKRFCKGRSSLPYDY